MVDGLVEDRFVISLLNYLNALYYMRLPSITDAVLDSFQADMENVVTTWRSVVSGAPAGSPVVDLKAVRNKYQVCKAMYRKWLALPSSGWVISPTTGIPVDKGAWRDFISKQPRKDVRMLEGFRTKGSPKERIK